jgi:hypothetical protein
MVNERDVFCPAWTVQRLPFRRKLVGTSRTNISPRKPAFFDIPEPDTPTGETSYDLHNEVFSTKMVEYSLSACSRSIFGHLRHKTYALPPESSNGWPCTCQTNLWIRPVGKVVNTEVACFDFRGCHSASSHSLRQTKIVPSLHNCTSLTAVFL